MLLILFAVLLSVLGGGAARHGPEGAGEVVVVRKSDLLGHAGNRKSRCAQKLLCRLDTSSRDELGNGFSARKLLCKPAELGHAHAQRGGDIGKTELLHEVSVKILRKQLRFVAFGAAADVVKLYV